MIERPLIQAYVNNFRRHIAPFLRPGIGLKCNVYPAELGGAVLVFQVGPGVENDDLYQQRTPTVGQALAKIEQRAFAGNLDGFVFGGTNVVLEDDRLILIKDSSPEEWSDGAARKDVRMMIQPHLRGAQ